MAKAFADAGASPVIEASWAGAVTAMAEVRPAAVVIPEPDGSNPSVAEALSRLILEAAPYTPAIIGARDNTIPPVANALAISDNATVEQLTAKVTSAQRLRTLHSTVLMRAQALKEERNIIAELPAGDPLDDATVMLVGRGRHYATLSVAIGERMGVIGSLSTETAERCLADREVSGIVIGDGLPARSIETFLATLCANLLYRDLPIAMLGASTDIAELPNFARAHDPQVLLQRMMPLIRARALESALKRLLKSIEYKGMLDVLTGLLHRNAFDQALSLAIQDAGERRTVFSIARFAFEQPLDRRTAVDAARLVSQLVRDTDFASQQEDNSILFVFGDTTLRDANVAARRLASVLKHSMLRLDRQRPNVSPAVTLATLKPGDTAQTLLDRVSPRPVAAA
ncbi:GGDEF domain-containing protein [Rhodoplanes sp. Z2-YC6860]|uniref:GGDEF domain-containing protein n=1 Tax=Rhodoplanes sp. Z2-YC6860 TaxID=674703 RepID=UPI0012ECC4A9|nr:GGDEF domain-containing protein [Rhodoplanes sp. Z2-YC6860]